MNSKTTIRLGSIEPAQRTLESMPEYKSETITKAQAIKMLITPILAARSKGYSLEAIAKILSDCGIPIPIGSLRAYVSEATADASGRTRKRKAKPTAHAKREAKQGDAPKSNRAGAQVEPTAAAAKPDGVNATGNVDLEWESSSRSKKTLGSGGFYIRPDRKDI